MSLDHECWLCGKKTTPKYRRVLNSDRNTDLLLSFSKLGALNLPSVLPSSALESERVYICRDCALEVSKWDSLNANLDTISNSIKSKLRSRGLLGDEATASNVSTIILRLCQLIDTLYKQIINLKCKYQKCTHAAGASYTGKTGDSSNTAQISSSSKVVIHCKPLCEGTLK